MQGVVVCYKCGQQNAGGQWNCWYCGTQIVSQCPYCHSAVYTGADHCGYCNMPLNWHNQQQFPSTMSCPWCHSMVYQGSPSCGYCGMPLSWPNQQQVPTTTVCPSCHSLIYQGSPSCGYCGTPFNWQNRQQTDESSEEDKPEGNIALKALSWVATGALTLVVLFLLFVHLSPDYDMYLVKSESMVPFINMGDMIFTGPVHNISPGTVITYSKGNSLVTHRIIQVNKDNVITKGDAVEDPDPSPITMSQLKGEYLFKIPSLGYVANFMRTKLGWFLVVILPSIILLGWIIWEIFKEVFKIYRRRIQTEMYAQGR